MFARDGVIIDKQPVAIAGKRVEFIAMAGALVYSFNFGPTPKDLLAAALAKAGAVNRYLYNVTTLGVFDPAYANAQTVHDAPGSTDTDYDNARIALLAAIAGLVKAKIGDNPPKSLMIRVNYSVDFKTYLGYNGIGSLKLETTSNLITVNPNWIITGKSNGTSVLTFAIVEDPEWIYAITVTVTN